jgi:hypothetical protein
LSACVVFCLGADPGCGRKKPRILIDPSRFSEAETTGGFGLRFSFYSRAETMFLPFLSVLKRTKMLTSLFMCAINTQ